MSKYTTEVRFICEVNAGLKESAGLSSVHDIITKSMDKIFDFDFPIFDEAYRKVLERKILMHYYTREICAESVGLWKLWLQMRLNEIMPYYNKLYESELIEFNPLYDYDYTKTYKKDSDGNEKKNTSKTVERDIREIKEEDKTENRDLSNTTNETDNVESSVNTTDITQKTGDSWEYYSDTPQGGVGDLTTLSYLTNATHRTNTDNTNETIGTVENTEDTKNRTFEEDEDKTTNINTDKKTDDDTESNEEVNRDITNTEDYLEHVNGKRSSVSYSKMLEEYRKTFLNIDMMIIGDLSDLFFRLW